MIVAPERIVLLQPRRCLRHDVHVSRGKAVARSCNRDWARSAGFRSDDQQREAVERLSAIGVKWLDRRRIAVINGFDPRCS